MKDEAKELNKRTNKLNRKKLLEVANKLNILDCTVMSEGDLQKVIKETIITYKEITLGVYSLYLKIV